MFTRHKLTVAVAALLGARAVCRCAPPEFAHSYALVIGIDKYSGGWQELRHARSDAEAIAEQLSSMGFEVRSLYDGGATKRDIIVQGFSDLAKKVRAEDQVLVFFAGHGHTTTDADGDNAFIVPWDGTQDPGTLISMGELEAAAGALNLARHQLFIMDSCYSGVFTAGVPTPADATIEQRGTRRARQIITAGTKGQEVVDDGASGHSLFTGAILEGLRGRADLNGDGYITASELMDFLRLCASTSQQTPTLAYFPGHDGGDFYLRSGAGALPAADEAYIRSCFERNAPAPLMPCDVNGDRIINVVDLMNLISQATGAAPCKNDLTGLRRCSVVGVQRVLMAVQGGSCHVGNR